MNLRLHPQSRSTHKTPTPQAQTLPKPQTLYRDYILIFPLNPKLGPRPSWRDSMVRIWGLAFLLLKSFNWLTLRGPPYTIDCDTYRCMHACMYVCMFVCLFVCAYVCLFTCIHLLVYACIPGYEPIYIYTYIHIYIYTCVCAPCVYVSKLWQLTAISPTAIQPWVERQEGNNEP